MSKKVVEQENIFQVGKHQIKNGWTLTVTKYEGYYVIEKSGVKGISANRVTGGRWGCGIWTIHMTDSVGADDTDIDVAGGFTREAVNAIIDQMEALMLKYGIKGYTFTYVPKSDDNKKNLGKWLKSKILKVNRQEG